jgi:hypothetical protein
MISDQLLEAAGVLGEASVSEWPMFFVPLADDVLSLELEDAVSDLYLVWSLTSQTMMMLTFHSEKTQRPSTSLQRRSCYSNKSQASSHASSGKATMANVSRICSYECAPKLQQERVPSPDPLYSG